LVSAVSGAIAAMVQEAKTDIIKMKGLSELMSTRAGAQKVIDRFTNSNVAKSVINTLMLDVEEEYERHEMQFSNLDKVMTLFLLVCAAAADIPATRLLGREPAGMNATGEGDLRNYYDRLSADQEVRLTPVLSKLDEVLIRSTLGSRDPDVHYTWRPLWQMSDEEKAKIELQKAQAFLIDVNTGLIDPQALKEGRQNSLVESGFLYPGLDAAIEAAEAEAQEEDVPEDQFGGALFQPGQPGQPQPGQPPGGQPFGGQFGGPRVAAKPADASDVGWTEEAREAAALAREKGAERRYYIQGYSKAGKPQAVHPMHSNIEGREHAEEKLKSMQSMNPGKKYEIMEHEAGHAEQVRRERTAQAIMRHTAQKKVGHL